jgi:hypothetical protein
MIIRREVERMLPARMLRVGVEEGVVMGQRMAQRVYNVDARIVGYMAELLYGASDRIVGYHAHAYLPEASSDLVKQDQVLRCA